MAVSPAHDILLELHELMAGVKLLAAELAATEQDAKRRAMLAQISDITERSAKLARSLLEGARPATPDAAPVSANEPVDPPRRSNVILVIDDDPMVRKVVVGTLDSLGYKTMEAATGARAIELYREHHDGIRAVLLDMVMPDMSGKATYLALRQIDPNVAVLLMTGHMRNAQVQEILDLGVRSYISKPYTIAELAAAVSALVQ